MTCSACVARVKKELLNTKDVDDAEVQLQSPQAIIKMQKHIPLETLQERLQKAGNYVITEHPKEIVQAKHTEQTQFSWPAYKPIFLIFTYITGITLLIELNRGFFIWEDWMQNFMAAFFFTFSFFKFLDLHGFAESYSTYDIIAKKWKGWGYVYAFIELVLGIAYMVHFNPLVTNGATFVVMSISAIGVLQTVLNKRKIRCACLGAVFNLPMSTITIAEDSLMIVMSAVMFFHMI